MKRSCLLLAKENAALCWASLEESSCLSRAKEELTLEEELALFWLTTREKSCVFLLAEEEVALFQLAA
jgi:hypothetical protein